MPLEISHDHVALRVVDYDGTVAWYREKLDFELDQEWPFGDMRLAYMPQRERQSRDPGRLDRRAPRTGRIT